MEQITSQLYRISNDKTVTVNTDKNVIVHVNEAKETWRPIATKIPVFMQHNVYKIKPIYEVSNFGRIRNIKTKKFISIRYSSETNSSQITLFSEPYPGYFQSLGYSPARVIFATYYPELVNNGDTMAFSKIKYKDKRGFNLSPDNLYMEK